MTDRSEFRPELPASASPAADEEPARPDPPLPDDALSVWTGRLAVAAFVGLLVFVIVAELGRERLRWRAASAYRTYLTAYERDEQGRIDEPQRRERIRLAVDELRKSLGNDSDARWRAVEASWLLEAGEIEPARKLLDELVEERPNWLAVRADRMTAAVTAGDLKQVVADCDWMEAYYGQSVDAYVSDPTSGASFTILIPNLRAYMLALANEQLDVAEKEIDRAIAAKEIELRQSEHGQASLLDTLGYVVFRKGDNERALKLFDQAVDLLDRPVETVEDEPGSLQIVRAYRVDAAKEAQGGREPDVASLERSRAVYELAQGLAVMFYHRALARRAAGDEKSADADLRIVEELGFEPNDKLF